MSETNKALVTRFYAAVNAGRIDVFDELAAPGFVEHEVFPGLEPTLEGAKKMFTMFRAAFPDLTLTVEDMVAEGDKVFVRATMSGTHRGEFMGIPATGRRIAVPFADVIRIADGRAAEHWGVTDTGAMMQQLGQAG